MGPQELGVGSRPGMGVNIGSWGSRTRGSKQSVLKFSPKGAVGRVCQAEGRAGAKAKVGKPHSGNCQKFLLGTATWGSSTCQAPSWPPGNVSCRLAGLVEGYRRRGGTGGFTGAVALGPAEPGERALQAERTACPKAGSSQRTRFRWRVPRFIAL